MLRNLFSVFRNDGSFFDALIIVGMYAIILFVALPFHEMAHAFMANKLGDSTARWNGRLTMNPLRHLDILGSAMILIVGIGYAKPVPVNPNNFRNPRKGMALTALAGPVSNLIMAILGVLIYRLCTFVVHDIQALLLLHLAFVQIFAGINIGLAVFNILPIPPLDGYRIFTPILPGKWLYFVDRYQQYITMGVLLLLFVGVLDIPLGFLQDAVTRGIGFLFGFSNINRYLL